MATKKKSSKYLSGRRIDPRPIAGGETTGGSRGGAAGGPGAKKAGANVGRRLLRRVGLRLEV